MTAAAPTQPSWQACRYPGCDRPVVAPNPGGGRRPVYCDLPEHTAARAAKVRRAQRGDAVALDVLTPAGERRRDELALLVAECFTRNGYHETTMRDLGRAAGVTQPVLYYYLGSKMDALLLIHETLLERLLRPLEKLVAQDLGATAKLREFVRVELEITELHYVEVMVYFREQYTLSPEAKERIRPKRERLQAILRQILNDGVRDGEFHIDSVDAVEMAIWGMINWSPTWLTPGRRRRAREQAEHFSNVLLGGIAARS